MIKMKDDSTKLMANLLHQGATMLDEYCTKCGKILFRLRTGKIFCPSCESELVSDKRYDENDIKEEIKKPKNFMYSEEIQEIYLNSIDILKKLMENLENIDDPIIFEKKIQNIILFIQLIQKIKSLK